MLATAAQLFEFYQPTDKARAALEILDATVHLPVPESRVTAYFLKNRANDGAPF